MFEVLNNSTASSDPISNFAEVLRCAGGDSCNMGLETDSGFLGAILFFFLPLAITPLVVLRSRVPASYRNVLSIAAALLWFWLCFGYTVPLLWDINSYLGWSMLAPIVSYLLMLGPALVAALAFVVVTSITSPGRWLPDSREDRAWLLVAVIAVLIGWWHLYRMNPTLSLGPYNREEPWLDYVLSIWPTAIPIKGLWTFAEFFAHPAAIVAFGLLSILVLALPMERVDTHATSLQRVASTSVSTVAVMVLTPVVTIVTAAIAAAIVSLVLLFAFAYFMAVGLVLAIAVMLISAAIKR